MTKKDYEIIAGVLSQFSVLYPIDKDVLVKRFCDALGQQNERFEAEKFKAAADRFKI